MQKDRSLMPPGPKSETKRVGTLIHRAMTAERSHSAMTTFSDENLLKIYLSTEDIFTETWNCTLWARPRFPGPGNFRADKTVLQSVYIITHKPLVKYLSSEATSEDVVWGVANQGLDPCYLTAVSTFSKTLFWTTEKKALEQLSALHFPSPSPRYSEHLKQWCAHEGL